MKDIPFRVTGIVLIAIGILLVYFTAIAPIQAAQQGAAEVTRHTKLLFLTPTALIFGILALALGSKSRTLLQTEKRGKQQLTLWGWIIVGVCIGGGIGLNEWLKGILSVAGYAH